MSETGPAIGERVTVAGEVVGALARRVAGQVTAVHLTDNTATVRFSHGIYRVPWARIAEAVEVPTPPPDAESRWRSHRDGLVAQGLSFNGISKRDFMAGYAAAA